MWWNISLGYWNRINVIPQAFHCVCYITFIFHDDKKKTIKLIWLDIRNSCIEIQLWFFIYKAIYRIWLNEWFERWTILKYISHLFSISAVKRLMREAKELSEATSDYYAQPLSDNLFEWHFTVGQFGMNIDSFINVNSILIIKKFTYSPFDLD